MTVADMTLATAQKFMQFEILKFTEEPRALFIRLKPNFVIGNDTV